MGRFCFFLSVFISIGLLKLAILPNYLIDIFSTQDTFPTPKLFGFMVELFISHNSTTTDAFHMEPLI